MTNTASCSKPKTAPVTSHVPKTETAPSSAKIADGNSAQSAKLAKTPPFESLRKMWGVSTQAEVSSIDSADGTTHRTPLQYSPSSPTPVPLARGRSGSRDPSSPVQQPAADRSPLSTRRSLPSSRIGSQNTLATLMESRHEDTDGTGGAKGYEEFVTHSMLLQSEVLPNEPSSTSPHWKTGQTGLQSGQMSLVPLGQWSDRSVGSQSNELRLPSALELSQQLADLQRHSSSFDKKRGMLFHIGDTENEDRVRTDGDLSPTQALVPSRIAAMKLDLSVIESNGSGRSTRRILSSGSMDDEMFSLEEEQVRVYESLLRDHDYLIFHSLTCA